MGTLEYVASGMGHTRIPSRFATENPEILDIINSYFLDLNGANDHKFSMLFNAFIEKNFGPVFHKNYKNSIYTIHADSGGLQILTQGKSITPELKDQIYKTQANYSDIAMCFDEIPVTMAGDRSDRNDTAGRFFDISILEEKARETGKNIKRQVEVFLDEKSKSKPMIIAQGNCYDTYMKWMEYLLDEIPQSYYEAIGGVAFGSAALGNGVFEDFQRAAFVSKMPFEMKNPYVHILGVGSIRRLIPYLVLMRNGYYPDNLHLSYDSTTLTSGLSLGNYYINDGLFGISRSFGEKYIILYNDINSKYGLDAKGICVNEFFKAINSTTDYAKESDGQDVDVEKLKKYYNCHISYVASSIRNFTKTVIDCKNDTRRLFSVSEKYGISKEVHSFSKVKTLDDFNYWQSAVRSSIRSKKVSNEKPSTLETYFE